METTSWVPHGYFLGDPVPTYTELRQMQSLPMRLKVLKTILRIREWYEAHDGDIYVAFSGGLDSTVLGHITLQLYPDVPLVFSNTGVELPQIVDFVKRHESLQVIRPKHSYKWVTQNYGFPVVSKSVSIAISRYRTAKDDVQRELRLHGGINPTSGKVQRTGLVPKKYHYLIAAPFPISDKCCDILKKQPFEKYDKETGRAPMTGENAEESAPRQERYLKTGCNYYGKEKHKSTPMGFWRHQDVLEYIVTNKVPYCRAAYGDIVISQGCKLRTTGCRRTGCYVCMFGLQHECPENNRFIQLEETNPREHQITMEGYGQAKVMDFMGIPYSRKMIKTEGF